MSDKAPIELLREFAKSPFWDAAYAEWQLPKCIKKCSIIQGILDKLGIDETTIDRADYDDDGDIMTATPEQYICHLLDNAREMIEYYEANIKRAHEHIALVKIIVSRVGLDDSDINLVEIEAEQRRRAQK